MPIHNVRIGREVGKHGWAAALLAAALAMLSFTPTAHADAILVKDLASGPGNGVYAFESHTPRTLPELLRAPHAAPAVNIVGHLFLPPGNAPVPAVVFMHGSGGLYDAMLGYWPQLLNAQGIAVLSLDTFSPRGVRSTVEDQSQVPFSADVEDVFSALRLLATHPRIQASRIAVLGTSRGGLAAWRSNVDKIVAAQQLPDGLRFAAHVQLYAGGCVGAFRLVVRPGVFGPAPMLWVHGDADDYTPIGPCRDYAERIDKAGTPVTFVTLPGARHKFDQDDARRITLRFAQKTQADCPLEFDIDAMAAHDSRSGERVSGEAYQQLLKQCLTQGAIVEGDRAARDKAGAAVVAFLRATLRP